MNARSSSKSKSKDTAAQTMPKVPTPKTKHVDLDGGAIRITRSGNTYMIFRRETDTFGNHHYERLNDYRDDVARILARAIFAQLDKEGT